MLTLDRLPNEVLHNIASLLHKKYDLAALSRTSRHCYNIASPILWKREAKSDRPGALHWAVEHGDLNVFNRALEAGVAPNRMAYAHKPKSRIDARHKWWNYHSSYYDDPEWRMDDDDDSVDLDPSYVSHDHCNCFEGGCDDGIFNDCSWEPIHVAASKGRIDMIEILLEKGASVDAFSWGLCLCRPHLPIEAFSDSRAVEDEELEDLHGGGWTPLHVAICHGQVEAAKYLVKRGASNVIYQGIDFELDVTGFDDEVNPDASMFRLTAMHHAAKHNQVELLQFLKDAKIQAYVDAEGPFMGTPLFQAIWYGHWDTVVPWLLKNGADIDARLIETRLTPLMMACFSRRFDDASRLIDLGASVSTMSIHQFSILHLILGPGQLRFDEYGEAQEPERAKSTVSEAEIITKFIAHGFPVNAREALLGLTPLMVAGSSCNLAAMKALIDGGADVNALDHDGLNALARIGEAAEGGAISGLYEAGNMLLDAGAVIKDSMEDLTPLNVICSRRCETYASRDWEEQHAKLAKLLIERGADPNEKGISKSPPFTEAVIHSNFTLARAILDSGGRPEPNDIEELLSKSAKDMYDDGKTEFIVSLDFAKYDMTGPSDAFLVRLIQTALNEQLWTRAADLIKVVPTPKEMRKGLVHRCLLNGSLTGDDPSTLVQTLLDLGESPNELWDDEPPIYYSLKSGYCWRSTPVLVNAGADINMPTKAMPDGAFMYSINQGYQSQSLQMLAKHPDVLCDRPERLHRECWASVIRWDHGMHPQSRRQIDAGEPDVPYLYWNIAHHLLGAGLRTDVTLADGREVRGIVEQAVPTDYTLGLVEQKVLEKFDIPYEEPVYPSDNEDSSYDEDEEDEYGVLGELLSDDGDESDGLDDYDSQLDGDEDYDEDDEEDDEEDGHMPMPPMPVLFGFYM
ncbi:ankyrin repeat-containing domain protein [Ilyonectria robusta]|uniref:ankyrin repeat-containing domain protein n=1 Tax=Ilyonectria robusta TaxID=1079257 RepID=UPI001E8DE628|nr:ankyrin repeat-containing domain protein [Ilyonectria robusta]KAH8733683.1 ankyrin repeat-containing domain protein [Ilyonectria robusta]